jgi:hypothetical protein
VIHGLLFLAPAILLLWLLRTRGYPGERLLLARLPRRRRPRARPARSIRGRVALVLGRPGRLVAGRHEIRGPPYLVAVPTT